VFPLPGEPFGSHIRRISLLREDRSCITGLVVGIIVEVEIQTDTKISSAAQKWRVDPEATIVIVQEEADEDPRASPDYARGSASVA
jgi:hypothetical protein